jgi:hypothetical protein
MRALGRTPISSECPRPTGVASDRRTPCAGAAVALEAHSWRAQHGLSPVSSPESGNMHRIVFLGKCCWWYADRGRKLGSVPRVRRSKGLEQPHYFAVSGSSPLHHRLSVLCIHVQRMSLCTPCVASYYDSYSGSFPSSREVEKLTLQLKRAIPTSLHGGGWDHDDFAIGLSKESTTGATLYREKEH